MDVTFISILDLTPEAKILYSSDSVIDILGYTPEEIANKSCWEFFSQDELPYAQMLHQRRVTTDNAAVLTYCNVKSKSGEYIGCECCFTIVYDVIVVCTSSYNGGSKSQGRALLAPTVRRLFTSSPKDPRYHMLSYLSSQFTPPTKVDEHEPRAALFLNRFTRTLTIMYATSGIYDIVGIPAAEMQGRSFYFCVAENCLNDAVQCLEQAKANDSIAYLRFYFRDPRTYDSVGASSADSDEEMTIDSQDAEDTSTTSLTDASTSRAADDDTLMNDESAHERSLSSGESTRPADTHEAIFGASRDTGSSASSLTESPVQTNASPRNQYRDDPIELEAVISCASDGLVVCLRKARPMIPRPMQRPRRRTHAKGMFAAPWANEPILPPVEARSGGISATPAFAPSLGPHGAEPSNATAAAAASAQRKGPKSDDFMAAIRSQAIFAWALTSINGSLANYCQSEQLAGAVPPNGFPVWANDTQSPVESSKMSDSTDSAKSGRSPSNGRHLPEAVKDGKQVNGLIFGDPGLAKTTPHADNNGWH